MKRKCIVCGRVYGESGDKQNGSVSGGICDACMLAIEEYRYYKRIYQATGFVEYERLICGIRKVNDSNTSRVTQKRKSE